MSHGRSSDETPPPQGKRFLHHSVADALRDRLAEGRFSGGMKLPTLRELAGEFNVSTMTIRQAFRLLEREGHVRRIPAVGAFVRSPAPPPEAPQQTVIALAMLDLGSAFEMGIARGVEIACQDRGWGLQVFDARTDPEVEARNLGRLPGSIANGAIVLPICDQQNIEVLFKLKLSNYRFVLVDRSTPGLNVDLVESNHEKGAHLATECLLRHGHRRVLMVTEPPMITSVAARIRGYERALIDFGLAPRPEWKIWIDPGTVRRGTHDGRRYLGGYAAALPVLKSLSEKDKPLALFAHNDYSAWGVIEACRELGLSVPREVSLICCDDSDIIRAMTPPLTAVAQRTVEIGRVAVGALERVLKAGANEVEPQHVLIDVDLVERQSVATVPAD